MAVFVFVSLVSRRQYRVLVKALTLRLALDYVRDQARDLPLYRTLTYSGCTTDKEDGPVSDADGWFLENCHAKT